MIDERLVEVEKNIIEACKKSNRPREEITLIAVSKTKPIPLLEEAYQVGIRNFGENKVQEMTQKYDTMEKDIKWHMIGHLQTNKVKYIIGKTSLIHSVDSYKLALEIEKQASKHNCVVDILIEVNISNETTKYGVMEQDVVDLITKISGLSHVHICGLMTVAPYVIDPEDNRLYFRKIKQLSVDIASQNIHNVDMNILSMGMSGDYIVAIEEGATMVRVGTSIFGERNYAL